MQNFSALEHEMNKFSQETELRLSLAKNEPWSGEDASKKSKEKRLELSFSDFWKFDSIYFKPEAYSDGYSKPSDFHKELVKGFLTPGVEIILGPRKHGKTATLKKFFCWLILTGRINFGGTLSAILPGARHILKDITRLIKDERIQFDFEAEFLEDNADQVIIRVKDKNKKNKLICLQPFSEGHSARGATFMFERPQFILGDDIETSASSMGEDQVEARIKLIRETAQSMANNGVLQILGNNSDERGALNQLLILQNAGQLPASWRVKVFKAWREIQHKGKLSFSPLWKDRYPAKTETELKGMVKAASESEWQGDFQQNPIPPDGYLINRDGLNWIDSIPQDCAGVIYVDPNLSKKRKGDSTAILSYLYSPSTGNRYITDIVCRSFSDPNKLLLSVINMYNPKHHRVLGMDGNVSQESTWTAFVRGFENHYGVKLPYIKYCRYHVDDLAKNFQAIWNEKKVFILSSLAGKPDTVNFLSQLFAFSGKKAGKLDDGPDAVICAEELLNERRLVRRRRGVLLKPFVVQDYYF